MRAGGGAANVRPSHLNVQNPLNVSEPLNDSTAVNLRKALNEHLDSVTDPAVGVNLRQFRSDIQSGQVLNPVLLSEAAKKELPAILKRAGYDGIHQGDVWMTFEPNQIRSTFESAQAKKLGTVPAKAGVSAMQDNLERVQIENETKMAAKLEEGRKTFAAEAPAVAAEGGSALRKAATKVGETAQEDFKKSRDLVFGEPKSAANPQGTPGFFGKIYTDLYLNVLPILSQVPQNSNRNSLTPYAKTAPSRRS